MLLEHRCIFISNKIRASKREREKEIKKNQIKEYIVIIYFSKKLFNMLKA